MSAPDLTYEHEAYRKGFRYIAGIDEAGRGCLAGPVVAAAVILPEGLVISGVRDSKKLTPGKRESLFNQINEQALAIGIGAVGHEDIDRINIFMSTKKAMEMAVQELPLPPDYLLIDAVSLSNLQITQQAIIKGDMLSVTIACASIIAKVTRDRMMQEHHLSYPQYDFLKHKGYGTKDHIERIRMYGPSDIHRRSFLKRVLNTI